MALVWQGPKSYSQTLSEVLAPSLGRGLANFTGGYLANKALEGLISDKSYANKPPEERLEALQNTLSPYGQFGQNVFNKRLQIEQLREDRAEQKALADITSGKEISPEKLASLSPKTQLEFAKLNAKKQEAKNIYDGLRKLGVPEEKAQAWQTLYANSPQGAQSEIIRGLNDDIRRAQNGEFRQEQQGEFPTAESFIPQGMLPAERVKWESDTRKTNSPIFEDLQSQTRFFKKENNALNILDDLNERQTLPEGIAERFVLIDPETGDLRPYVQVVKGANPDTQRFIKTIYDFTTQAKDSFGARVTNFDLTTFLKRLPGLMNTYDGRKQIIEQMKLINQLNSLYSNSMKDVFTHYGLGKIPYEKAVQIAENRITDQEEALTKQFESIGLNQGQEANQAVPEGEIKVRAPNGQIGTMTLQNYEQAIKDGEKFERVD